MIEQKKPQGLKRQAGSNKRTANTTDAYMALSETRVTPHRTLHFPQSNCHILGYPLKSFILRHTHSRKSLPAPSAEAVLHKQASRMIWLLKSHAIDTIILNQHDMICVGNTWSDVVGNTQSNRLYNHFRFVPTEPLVNGHPDWSNHGIWSSKLHLKKWLA